MPRFHGTWEHSLDTKGRIVLPARLRRQLDSDEAFVSQYLEGCLAVWTAEDFNRRFDTYAERAELGRAQRNLFRVWTSQSQAVEIDKQGRLAIPAHLRVFAGLESLVRITGIGDRIELWSPERWGDRIGPAEVALADHEGPDVFPLGPPNATAPAAAPPTPQPLTPQPPVPES